MHFITFFKIRQAVIHSLLYICHIWEVAFFTTNGGKDALAKTGSGRLIAICTRFAMQKDAERYENVDSLERPNDNFYQLRVTFR